MMKRIQAANGGDGPLRSAKVATDQARVFRLLKLHRHLGWLKVRSLDDFNLESLHWSR